MDAAARAAQVARASYGKLVALLASRSGDVMAAEDALADAFEQALRTWPRDGVPERPEAWLLTVARRRRVDAARRAARVDLTDEVPEMLQPPPDPELIPDTRLALLYVCAHPAIAPSMHAALMMQTVLGIEAEAIAQAFALPSATMAQRLVRAKRKIKAARIPFETPEPDQRPARTGAVCEAIYGAFALDWAEAESPLAEEAHYLALLLAQLTPEDPEALGLAALITLIQARVPARQGAFVALSAQETRLWNADLINQGNHLLAQASQLGAIGRFQLEAAIQSVHAARRDTGETDWRAIRQLYTGLRHIAPTLGAAIGHAAAVGEAAGPAQGLALLDALDPTRLATYQPAWACRAHLLAQLERRAEAAEAYARAIALTRSPTHRDWLRARRQALPPD